MQKLWLRNGNYNSGFELTPDALVQLRDVARKEITKGNTSEGLTEEYLVIFNRGAVIYDRLEEVFQLENSSTKSILSLTAKFESVINEFDTRSIEIKYAKGNNLFNFTPVKSTITSLLDEDWVEISDQKISSSIQKTLRPSYGFRFPYFVEVVSIAVLVFLYWSLPKMNKPSYNDFDISNPAPTYTIFPSILDLDSLRKLNIQNPVEAQFSLAYLYAHHEEAFDWKSKEWQRLKDKWYDEKIDEFEKKHSNKFYKKHADLSILLIVAFLYASLYFIKYNFPLYNFIWGGYVLTFKRKVFGVRYIVFTILIEAILCGIFVNLITS